MLESGKNPTLRYLGRTHRIDLRWVFERFSSKDFEIRYCTSEEQAADIFTKHFVLKEKWDQVTRAIGHITYEELFPRAASRSPKTPVKVSEGFSPRGSVGGAPATAEFPEPFKGYDVDNFVVDCAPAVFAAVSGSKPFEATATAGPVCLPECPCQSSSQPLACASCDSCWPPDGAMSNDGGSGGAAGSGESGGGVAA